MPGICQKQSKDVLLNVDGHERELAAPFALHVEVGLWVPNDPLGRARVAVGDGRHQGGAQPLPIVSIDL